MLVRLFAILSLVFSLVLAGCGQKGPLYRDQGGATAGEAVQTVTDGQADQNREQSDN